MALPQSLAAQGSDCEKRADCCLNPSHQLDLKLPVAPSDGPTSISGRAQGRGKLVARLPHQRSMEHMLLARQSSHPGLLVTRLGTPS